jgi:flagellar biosynthesis/type III secretory pathway protein FliH
MARRSCITIDVAQSPLAARLLDVSLDEYSQARRAQREQELRGEGFAPALQALEGAVDALGEVRAELRNSVVETSVQLALEITQELVRKELSLGNYDIPAIVREVLSSASSASGTLVLRVNPEDASALSQMRFRSGTQVESDPTVRRGDVQLQTDQGLLVRNIDNCLQTIRESLQEAFRSC